jgi:hypothetical protein
MGGKNLHKLNPEIRMFFKFCRVVRNALAHKSIVTIDNKNFLPVSWGKLTIQYSDNGKDIRNDIYPGDMLALMLIFDKKMSYLGAPHF